MDACYAVLDGLLPWMPHILIGSAFFSTLEIVVVALVVRRRLRARAA